MHYLSFRSLYERSPLCHCSQDFSLRQFLLTNLVGDGRRFPQGQSLRWKVNLDAIESSILTLKGFPKFETTYDRPALFIGGGNSNYITWVKSVKLMCSAIVVSPVAIANYSGLSDHVHWLNKNLHTYTYCWRVTSFPDSPSPFLTSHEFLCVQ